MSKKGRRSAKSNKSHARTSRKVVMSEMSSQSDMKGVMAKALSASTLKPDQSTLNEVLLKIIGVRITDVDLNKEQFNAEIFLKISWKHIRTQKGKEKWSPQLYIENMVEVYYENAEITNAKMAAVDGMLAVQDMRLAGTFSNTMNWKYYPFDAHKLKFIILSRLSPEEINITLELQKRNVVLNVVENDKVNNEVFVYSSMIKGGRIYDLEAQGLGVFIEVLAMRKTLGFHINYFIFEFLLTCIPLVTLIDHNVPHQKVNCCVLSLCMSVFVKNLIFTPSPEFAFTSVDVYHTCSMFSHCLVLLFHTIRNMAGELRYLNVINQLKRLNDYVACTVYASLQVIFNVAFICWIHFQPDRNPELAFFGAQDDSDIYRESMSFF